MKPLTSKQEGAVQILRVTLQSESISTREMKRWEDCNTATYVLFMGIHGNTLFSLKKRGAIKWDDIVGACDGGWWIAGLQILA